MFIFKLGFKFADYVYICIIYFNTLNFFLWRVRALVNLGQFVPTHRDIICGWLEVFIFLLHLLFSSFVIYE